MRSGDFGRGSEALLFEPDEGNPNSLHGRRSSRDASELVADRGAVGFIAQPDDSQHRELLQLSETHRLTRLFRHCRIKLPWRRDQRKSGVLRASAPPGSRPRARRVADKLRGRPGRGRRTVQLGDADDEATQVAERESFAAVLETLRHGVAAEPGSPGAPS